MKVEKLETEMETYQRSVWIAVRGIPLFLWSKDTMVGISKEWGQLLAMEAEIEYTKIIDEAHVFIQTQCMNDIENNITLRYGEQEFCVKIKEMMENKIGLTSYGRWCTPEEKEKSPKF